MIIFTSVSFTTDESHPNHHLTVVNEKMGNHNSITFKHDHCRPGTTHVTIDGNTTVPQIIKSISCTMTLEDISEVLNILTEVRKERYF